MQIRSAVFVTGARKMGECPDWDRPEFAFTGRSNVGKSTLINLLTNRRELAKVSGTPGKTRELNFFLVNEAWSLVDLPGYGYARASKMERSDFNELAAGYLEGRKNLRRVFVLIDARHPPQRLDVDFTGWLREVGVPFSLIFNKADKQSAARTRGRMEKFLEVLGEGVGEVPEVMTASGKTGAGRGEILEMIEGEMGGS